MFQCFICSTQSESIPALLLHLRIIHKLEKYSRYVCIQENCNRIFSDLKGYSRHLKNKHNTITTDIKCEQNSQKIDVCNHQQLENTNFANLSDTNNESSTENISNHITFEEIYLDIENQANILISKLYSYSTVPRRIAQEIILDFEYFFSSGFIEILKNKILQQLRKQQLDTQFIDLMSAQFDILQNPFNNFSSEYKCLKKFENSENLIKPIAVTIGTVMSEKKIDNHMVFESKEVSVQTIPLRSVFKKVFEIPNFYASILDYTNLLQQSHTKNFIQSDLWKLKLTKFRDSNSVFPIFLYYDDYESGNPLGSHSGIYKIGAIYISFPSLPPEFRSTLDNIFLACLFYTNDKKRFGNYKTLKSLIDELIYLETEGIDIQISGQVKRIYFCLGLIIGDNLGLHSLLGFVESFSAKHPCRFCKISKHEQQTNYFLLESVSNRNTDNYTDDVNLNDCNQTGIKEMCIFNEIPSFHVTENFSVDIMHDVLEGVCHYDIINILKKFIFEKKYFSLDTLNFKLKTFNFSSCDLRNIPPLIPEGFQKRNKLSMSASEMHSFVKIFSLMVGEYIPTGDLIWELYICLREILDIIFSEIVSDELANLLYVLVSEHNQLYLQLFNDTLKPKHHHLLHYSQIMKMVGPLKDTWAMRFENKNYESKRTANVNSSRKNIIYSLALKHQLRVCYRLFVNKKLERQIVVGPNISNWNSIASTLKLRFPMLQSEYIFPKWINVNGIIYKEKEIIIRGVTDMCPQFAMIKFIVVSNDHKNIYFVCNILENNYFDTHFHVHRVTLTSAEVMLNYNDLVSVQLCAENVCSLQEQH